MKRTIKRGQWVHFRWSASECHSAKFVRWERSRMHTGGKDTNKIGVAAVVRSDWLFSKVIVHKVPRGLKRGQYRLRPYTDLFFTLQGARTSRGWKVKRPSPQELVK